MKLPLKMLTLSTVTTAMLMGIAATQGNFASQVLPGQPAVAGFWDGIGDRIVPSGMFFEVNGRKYYFGEYSDRGDDAIVFKGSKWEIKHQGRVSAHGYGQTPSWVVDTARRFFRF